LLGRADGESSGATIRTSDPFAMPISYTHRDPLPGHPDALSLLDAIGGGLWSSSRTTEWMPSIRPFATCKQRTDHLGVLVIEDRTQALPIPIGATRRL